MAHQTDMSSEHRPLGSPVENWRLPPWPHGLRLEGAHVTLEPLNAIRHAADLFAAYDGHDWLWDYMPYGPFEDFAGYEAWLRVTLASNAHLFLALIDARTGRAVGVASYLRIDPASGSIEVGNINFAPALQRTVAATEAMFLMMQWAFDAGYRRYEWKCNALNAPSRRAAERLGFSFEGVFRQALIVKGRNRDTAWFGMTDQDWPGVKAAFEAWLAPGNFDATGVQRTSLAALTGLCRVASDPTL